MTAQVIAWEQHQPDRADLTSQHLGAHRVLSAAELDAMSAGMPGPVTTASAGGWRHA